MWCGKCYTSAPHPRFFTADPDNLFSEEGDDDRLVSGWKPKSSDKGRYRQGRDGDDLLVAFECDYCVFRKVYERPPDESLEKDRFGMGCIRRILLDSFWSRSRSTVNSNTYRYREIIRMSNALGFEAPYSSPGPLPRHDHCGYKLAILMVAKSLEPGRHSNTHMQWDTIRKLRASYSNQIRAAAVSNSTTLTLSDNKGSGYERVTVDPCGSLWFHRFMTGCKNRMGQDCRPNRAISSALIVELLRLTETRIRDADSFEDRERWVMAGAYFCFCFVVSLRSPEGLMTDLEGLIRFENSSDEFVIIPLKGQVKGESHTRQHLLHSVNVTDSGIEVRAWIRRLLMVHRVRGRTSGPAFIDPTTSIQSTTSDMNDSFLELLTDLFDSHRGLFGVDIESNVDISEKYHVFRSFRRGSESQAVAKRVAEADRYIVNRWKKKEAAGTKKANLPIDQHYVDVSLVKDSFLRYTKAM
jgi:hypothetical protein